MFTHENGDLDGYSVTERSCAAPISKLDRLILDRFSVIFGAVCTGVLCRADEKVTCFLFDIFKLPSFKKRNIVFVSTAEMKYSGDVLEVVQNTQSTFLSSLKIRALRSRIFDADKTLKKKEKYIIRLSG